MGKGTRVVTHTVAAWHNRGVLFERYAYAPGPAEATPPHAHDDYQLCLSLDFPGELAYRGGRHGVPVGAVNVVHPGEPHACRDLTDRPGPTHFLVFYAPPARVRALAGEFGRTAPGDPFFGGLVGVHHALAAAFRRYHEAAGVPGSPLAVGEAEREVWRALFERLGGTGPPPPVGREDRRVADAVGHLKAHFAEAISLEGLAARVGLSAFHFQRCFRAAVGLSPARYQDLLRVERAKRLLAAGTPPADVAAEVGYCDQSHLNRRFRYWAQVTPGRYRKIVQDAADGPG